MIWLSDRLGAEIGGAEKQECPRDLLGSLMASYLISFPREEQRDLGSTAFFRGNKTTTQSHHPSFSPISCDFYQISRNLLVRKRSIDEVEEEK